MTTKSIDFKIYNDPEIFTKLEVDELINLQDIFDQSHWKMLTESQKLGLNYRFHKIKEERQQEIFQAIFPSALKAVPVSKPLLDTSHPMTTSFVYGFTDTHWQLCTPENINDLLNDFFLDCYLYKINFKIILSKKDILQSLTIQHLLKIQRFLDSHWKDLSFKQAKDVIANFNEVGDSKSLGAKYNLSSKEVEERFDNLQIEYRKNVFSQIFSPDLLETVSDDEILAFDPYLNDDHRKFLNDKQKQKIDWKNSVIQKFKDTCKPEEKETLIREYIQKLRTDDLVILHSYLSPLHWSALSDEQAIDLVNDNHIDRMSNAAKTSFFKFCLSSEYSIQALRIESILKHQDFMTKVQWSNLSPEQSVNLLSQKGAPLSGPFDHLKNKRIIAFLWNKEKYASSEKHQKIFKELVAKRPTILSFVPDISNDPQFYEECFSTFDQTAKNNLIEYLEWNVSNYCATQSGIRVIGWIRCDKEHFTTNLKVLSTYYKNNPSLGKSIKEDFLPKHLK